MQNSDDLLAYLPLLNTLLPVGLWMAYWFFLVDWKALQPVLARGGWLPVVLIGYLAGLAWSRIMPGPCSYFGLFSLDNYWGHLVAVYAIILCALISGWLQSAIGYQPAAVANKPGSHSDTAPHPTTAPNPNAAH